jgi:hypothetical protein
MKTKTNKHTRKTTQTVLKELMSRLLKDPTMEWKNNIKDLEIITLCLDVAFVTGHITITENAFYKSYEKMQKILADNLIER